MSWGFNSVKHNDREVSVDIAVLRRQAATRLNNAQKQLAQKDGARNAANEDGLIGSLLLGMLTWGPLMQVLDMAASTAGIDMGPANSVLNNTLVCAFADAAGIVFDDEAKKNRQRTVCSLYPEGRRKAAGLEREVNRKFNLVAANQNARLAYDLQAEVACMSELVDMLDDLERDGVTVLRMDPSAPVYDTLKKARAGLRKDATVSSFTLQMRKSA